MRITFVTRKFGNVEHNSHCDVLHFTPVRVARLFLDCNGVFAIKAYCGWIMIHASRFSVAVGIRPSRFVSFQTFKSSIHVRRGLPFTHFHCILHSIVLIGVPSCPGVFLIVCPNIKIPLSCAI